MAEIAHELDPGIEVRDRAEHLGLIVDLHTNFNRIASAHSFTSPIIKSEVHCAPQQAVFEPEALTELLRQATDPSGQLEPPELILCRAYFRTNALELPTAQITRKIGSYSARSILSIEGIVPREQFQVLDVTAESSIKIFPSVRLMQDRATMNYVYPRNIKRLSRKDPERIAFNEAYKRNISFIDRINHH